MEAVQDAGSVLLGLIIVGVIIVILVGLGIGGNDDTTRYFNN